VSWPIFLINLERDVERRVFMQNQLSALGLVAEWFPAVLGRTLSETAIAALYSVERNQRRYPMPLTAGEIGCYASHLLVWRRLLDSNAEAALVLEDDVELLASLPDVVGLLRDRLDSRRWDMIKLIGRLGRELVLRELNLGAASLIRYRRVPSYTGAYVVSRVGAEKLLASRQPFGRPIDVDLRFWWENRLNVFGALPYPVAHAPIGAASSIGRKGEKLGLAYRLRRTRYNVELSLCSVLGNVFWLQRGWPLASNPTSPPTPKTRL
jgi:glycosyl transferase, family 25